eukprot:CAMPEP_0172457500 /NCGR_PEP_ID=MMETSP1065-20121228/22656_1 /TAXON_ID=265537 /ORGANISM="Amphiprora paludosa, Strain CCMP125" /LENGTH=108 /DNA_ID=CAMNT_0013211287 /DNA_START=159 /DNA_END=485 /DNA_ORIENTATION=+
MRLHSLSGPPDGPPTVKGQFSYVEGSDFFGDDESMDVEALGGDPFFLMDDDDDDTMDVDHVDLGTVPPELASADETSRDIQLTSDSDSDKEDEWEWDGKVDEEAHLGF